MSYYLTNENSFLNINNAHLKVSGNVHADVMKIGAVEFAPIASNVTTTTNFTNVETGLTTSSNLHIGGTLTMGTVEVIATTHNLENTTTNGNITPHTVEFTNPTTSLVASGNVEVGGNVVAGYLYGDGSNITGISSNLDQIVNIGNVTSNTVQFTNATTGFVTTANVEVGGELTVSGNVTVDTDTFHVDTATNRVGIGTSSPLSELELYKATGGAELLINTGDITPPTIRLWNFDNNNYNNHAAGYPVGTINFSGNERLTGDTHTDDSREFSYANTLYDWARISGIYVGSSSTSTSQGYVRGDLAFYTNNGDGATSDLQERMRIRHNGNVGIGTSSPSRTLDVHGAARPSGYPFAIGGTETNRARYVAVK